MASEPSRNDSGENVSVAKINSRQAIIVASITALSGIIAGFTGYKVGNGGQNDSPSAPAVAGIGTSAKPPVALTGGLPTSENPPAAKQRWITIQGIIPSSELPEGTSIRLVAMVNSQAYSYPSRAVWAEIGLSASREEFPLPVDDPEYKIRFEAFVQKNTISQPIVAGSQQVQHVRMTTRKLSSQEVQPVQPATTDEPIYREYPLYLVNDGVKRSASPTLTVKYAIK